MKSPNVLCLGANTFSDFVVGRLGGDEFAIYIPLDEFVAESIERFAAQLIESSSEPIGLGQQSAQVGCSIGISHMNSLHIDLENCCYKPIKPCTGSNTEANMAIIFIEWGRDPASSQCERTQAGSVQIVARGFEHFRHLILQLK